MDAVDLAIQINNSANLKRVKAVQAVETQRAIAVETVEAYKLWMRSTQLYKSTTLQIYRESSGSSSGNLRLISTVNFQRL